MAEFAFDFFLGVEVDFLEEFGGDGDGVCGFDFVEGFVGGDVAAEVVGGGGGVVEVVWARGFFGEVGVGGEGGVEG